MNSGCYGEEISDILISIKVIDFKGNIQEIKERSNKILLSRHKFA